MTKFEKQVFQVSFSRRKEMGRAMKSPLFKKELAYRLRQIGAIMVERIENGDHFDVFFMGNKEISKMDYDGSMYIHEPDDPDTKMVLSIFHDVSEYVDTYERASPDPRLPEDWKVLASYNSRFVWAAHDTEYGMQFATWRYTMDNTGVWSGDYTFDYAASRLDFLDRASLKSEEQFTKQELGAIYRGLTYQVGEYNLDEILNKLEEYIPEVVQQVNEDFSDENELDI